MSARRRRPLLSKVEARNPVSAERLRAAREPWVWTRRRCRDAEVVGAVDRRPRIRRLSRIPGNTFIRGFVRNYARVVRLDPGELVADLDAPFADGDTA